MRWLTSDHHFFHRRLNEEYCRETRGFSSVDEMNAQLIARWNESISPDDEVLVVGDVFVTRRASLEERVGLLGMLNGWKTLIRGNHDEDLRPFKLSGWSITDRIWMEEERVLVIHKRPDPRWGREELRITEELNPLLVVHGHDHRHDIPDSPGCLNVCVDRWNLRPVPWTEVTSRLAGARCWSELHGPQDASGDESGTGMGVTNG